ncbi:hypothetical protein [Polymorphospora rubra]|uniref:Uncharacterized protein n=1 Tax=Polymorphospora rubra TaxID=338584 RepID=A0A810MX78_9ACTN|nr:hypothetical protein [Polymorphospora rubra]BCJ65104.1 hypothetical protein Prubr_21250 [Polymorphospora rubra]
MIADLAPAERVAVARILAEHGWTARDFLIASLTLLTKNPAAMLDRLAQFRPPSKKGCPPRRPPSDSV